MLQKKVKLLLEQLQVCIFVEIVFGVRFTLNQVIFPVPLGFIALQQVSTVSSAADKQE